MPRAITYAKGSIIYFSGDKDERIFILQKGIVVLSSVDIETGAKVTEQVREGEFFGVKSAFGHFPREETATVLADSMTISMSVQEFEQLFSSNKMIIMKMLRVFSNQLRAVHKKIESILKSNTNTNQYTGMQAVAQAFFNDEAYKSCCDVCLKFLQRFPEAPNKNDMAKLYQDAKKRYDLLASRGSTQAAAPVIQPTAAQSALAQFSLPAFQRFQKTYEPGSVIISEFEPGDCFYLIQSGQVQLVKTVKDQNKNLDILMPSEFFGEMAILENTPRSATCVASGTVQCLEFNKANFEVLMTGNPQLALILLKLFCKRIYDQKRRLQILVINDPQARIGDVFLMFDEMNPVSNPAERSRRFNLTAGDVSHWAGLPVETVRDELNKFVEKHKIEIFDNYLVINNIVDMKRMVDQKKAQRQG